MKLINLKLKNFGLFKEAEITPQSINLITGKNLDNPNQSGNGSAKSTIGKLSIIFLLYGEGCGKKLERLVHFGTKEAIVEAEIEHNGDVYKIIRTIKL